MGPAPPRAQSPAPAPTVLRAVAVPSAHATELNANCPPPCVTTAVPTPANVVPEAPEAPGIPMPANPATTATTTTAFTPMLFGLPSIVFIVMFLSVCSTRFFVTIRSACVFVYDQTTHHFEWAYMALAQRVFTAVIPAPSRGRHPPVRRGRRR